MITQHIDKPRATQMARNLSRHLAGAHGLDLPHAKAMHALAATLGYKRLNAMTADLKAGSGAAAPLPETLWVALIEDQDSCESFVQVFPDRREATRFLTGYALADWFVAPGLAEAHPDPLAFDDDWDLLNAYADQVDTTFFQLFDAPTCQLLGPPEPADSWTRVDVHTAAQHGWVLDLGLQAVLAEPGSGIDPGSVRARVETLAARGEPTALRALHLLAGQPARYIATAGTASDDPDTPTLWTHIFDEADGATTLRFVYDLTTQTFVTLEADSPDGWMPLDGVAQDDLRDSLHNANPDLLETPGAYGLALLRTPPAWAPTA